jgi:hypothetical protein
MSSNNPEFLNRILQISNETEFEELALEVFDYQFHHVDIYRNYCQVIGKTKPRSIQEIPFLPIEFFKTHRVLDRNATPEIVFKSSGTTGAERSIHEVAHLKLYEVVSTWIFERFFGPLEDFVIYALLPNYIAQGESSLVYMVNHFIQRTRNKLSGFYLNDLESLPQKIDLARQSGKKVIMFGVTYALLDLVEKHIDIDLSEVYVIETGGMKGRRKELPKEALHDLLRSGLNLNAVYSEYGMTELLSQAYCKNLEPFVTPPWMKILIRDANDPMTFQPRGSLKTGGVSVIDLANIHSCSFIHTQDLGRYEGQGFKLLGRFDHSDIRGCNQLLWGYY